MGCRCAREYEDEALLWATDNGHVVSMRTIALKMKGKEIKGVHANEGPRHIFVFTGIYMGIAAILIRILGWHKHSLTATINHCRSIH